MSTSGGNTTGRVGIPTGRSVVLGALSAASALGANNQLLLGPVYNPAPFQLLSAGFNITVAGDAGCLITPTIFLDNGQGFPGAELFAGTPVPGDAVALALAACNVLVPAGWVWSGGVASGAPAVRPSASTYQASTAQMPTGDVRAYQFSVGACFAAQGAAFPVPAVFAGTFGGNFAPALIGTT